LEEPGSGVAGIDHVNLRTSPEGLERIARFYADVLGLVDGPRPNGRDNGRWLYAGDRPIVHLSAVAGSVSVTAADKHAPGFDHVAFHARGGREMRARLAALGVSYQDRARRTDYQIVLTDPDGTKVELNFAPREAHD